MGQITLLGAGRGNTYSAPALWTPNDEASLLGWWDFSDTGSYSGTTWTKRWGTLPNLIGAGVGPTKITTGFSGDKHALSFVDTSNNALTITSPGFTEIIVALAMNVTAIDVNNALVWNRGFAGVGDAGLLLVDTYGIQVRYKGSVAEDYALTMPSQKLVVGRHSINSRIIRLDGALLATDSTTATGSEPASSETFELFRDVGTTNYTVQLAAIGIFSSSGWSTTLAEKIEGFICNNNYGHTTAILPGGHPYKSSPP